MIRAMPTASLRSLLLICILRAALACLASIQITGNPSRPSAHLFLTSTGRPLRDFRHREHKPRFGSHHLDTGRGSKRGRLRHLCRFLHRRCARTRLPHALWRWSRRARLDAPQAQNKLIAPRCRGSQKSSFAAPIVLRVPLPSLAQSGPADISTQCPLMRGKRT
jgi:hypothetical protein